MSDAIKWPVCDEEGYYMSYKSWTGRWQNYWRNNKPGNIKTLYDLFTTKNENGGFDDADIDTHLQIVLPYWLEKEHEKKVKGDTKHCVGSGIRATWLGHASVLAEIDGLNVLCDPIFSNYTGCEHVLKSVLDRITVAFKRYRDPPCTVDELPDNIDAVFISHTHYDHLDSYSVEKLHSRYANSIQWYVPKDTISFFRYYGISDENIHEMVWWEEAELKGAKIIFTPSNHYSNRGALDMNKALWGSFAVIGQQGNRFWFGGDTAYCDVFKQIGKKLGPFQLSAIPIGAYAPRETLKYNHVDPEEAIQIHHDIRSEISFGIHWGTFHLGATEHYLEPKVKIEQARLNHGKSDDGDDKLRFYIKSVGGTQEGKPL